MDRKAQLLGDATTATRILEIGPSHAPVAPKRDGWNSYVVDHADRAGLRAKYEDAGVDLDAIEEVDAVWAGGRLDVAIPAHLHGTFDRLIASHVIEHIPDPITLLVSAQTLMARDGVVSLAVPDKRYCFDMFKPHATTGDLLMSHDRSGPGRHNARTLFHQGAYSAEGQFPDGRFLGAWGQHPVSQARLMGTLPEGFEQAARIGEPDYIDAHAWHFTPNAFALAMLELGEGGLIDWHLDTITPAHGAEFFVTLRRGYRAFPSAEAREKRRMELLLGIFEEMREQIDWLALGGLLSRPALPAEPVLARHLQILRDEYLRRIDAIAAILAPPNDTPAALGTLADITARMDALQRQIATIVAADGTQASIMGSLEQIVARQAAQQALIDDLLRQLDVQNRMLASLTAPDGTQASIMGSLELTAARQQQRQQAIEGAAHQALEAARLGHALGGRLDAQDRMLAEQQRALDEQRRMLGQVHASSTRFDRIVAPLIWLRSRFRRG